MIPSPWFSKWKLALSFLIEMVIRMVTLWRAISRVYDENMWAAVSPLLDCMARFQTDEHERLTEPRWAISSALPWILYPDWHCGCRFISNICTKNDSTSHIDILEGVSTVWLGHFFKRQPDSGMAVPPPFPDICGCWCVLHMVNSPLG